MLVHALFIFELILFEIAELHPFEGPTSGPTGHPDSEAKDGLIKPWTMIPDTFDDFIVPSSPTSKIEVRISKSEIIVILPHIHVISANM